MIDDLRARFDMKRTSDVFEQNPARLLLALSGHSSLCGFMSAFGGKADIVRIGDLCLLMTQSDAPQSDPANTCVCLFDWLFC